MHKIINLLNTHHAFTLTPMSTSSAKSAGNSCVLKLIFSAGIPLAMALLTSNPDDASMCIPFLLNNFNMVPLGQAFIAYRTVSPYALGNARHASAF